MYYLLEFGDKQKRIPFKIIGRNEHHIEMQSMKYPSAYGMSRPFRMSAHPMDLTQPLDRKGLIRWVENREAFAETVLAAHRGFQREKDILKEWDKIKSKL